MMIENTIKVNLIKAVSHLYSVDLDDKLLNISKTKPEHEGDFTLVVFPMVRLLKKTPEIIANELGNYLVNNVHDLSSFNVIKGFLNIKISSQYWLNYSKEFDYHDLVPDNNTIEKIVIEFSSPNTNKPLHLGHIRNNLLGVALSNILKFVKNDVNKVSLLNNRGIHICKSMVAWEEWGNSVTPEQAGKKGDHLIGDFYVLFNTKFNEEISELMASGMTKEEAINNSTLLQRAKNLLKRWERGKKEVVDVWKKLNDWVEEGFNITYKELGVEFDKVYYESDTYLKGKDSVVRQMSTGIVKLNDDGSTSIDLTDVGLDEKILLRSDGTSVYITQDIGTAIERYEEYNFDKQIYVVGNEQIYHFKVLKQVLNKFGYDWYNKIDHFSYGMVELPEGKMKSREGTVVDADDLIAEMVKTAKEKTLELGKLQDATEQEIDEISKKIAMGALKYFILKVDPRKNMLFNPNESIDFNGNTGPFIQYSYTRIYSLLKKATKEDFTKDYSIIKISQKEIDLIKETYLFSTLVSDVAKNLNPAAIANYLYNLARMFNNFYHEMPILKLDDEIKKAFRLKLSENIAVVIKTGLSLLGIEVPSRM